MFGTEVQYFTTKQSLKENKTLVYKNVVTPINCTINISCKLQQESHYIDSRLRNIDNFNVIALLIYKLC